MKKPIFILLLFTQTIAISQVLQGTITDKESKETLPFTNIALYQNGLLQTGTTTDFDGNYKLENIQEGNYDIIISFVGYDKDTTKNVQLTNNKTITLDAALIPQEMDNIVYYEPWRRPIMENVTTPLPLKLNKEFYRKYRASQLKTIRLDRKLPIIRNTRIEVKEAEYETVTNTQELNTEKKWVKRPSKTCKGLPENCLVWVLVDVHPRCGGIVTKTILKSPATFKVIEVQ